MTKQFKTYENEIGTVVSPGAWMFHKGLTFTRRKSSLKMLKNLYGIWYVATQLGDFSEQAIVEFNVIGKSHSKWSETLEENLHIWMENASPIDWLKLEAQDPSGKLRKLNFERSIENLLGTKSRTR